MVWHAPLNMRSWAIDLLSVGEVMMYVTGGQRDSYCELASN